MLQLSSLSACVISITILYGKSQILKSLLGNSLPQQHRHSTDYYISEPHFHVPYPSAVHQNLSKHAQTTKRKAMCKHRARAQTG